VATISCSAFDRRPASRARRAVRFVAGETDEITKPEIEIHRNRRVTVYSSNEPFGSFVGKIRVDALDSLP
jgi:hypothetical protein